jgi:hypothetical protein
LQLYCRSGVWQANVCPGSTQDIPWPFRYVPCSPTQRTFRLGQPRARCGTWRLAVAAEQYVRDWALPQFYFHVMTAYAIMRAKAVELAKADYVAHMFSYLRPTSSASQ